MDESSIPDDVKQALRQKLERALRLAGGNDLISEIEELTIETYRHLSQRLPLRVYVYDVEDPMGSMEFDLMRQSKRPPGSVFETGIYRARGRRYGYYLYCLQPAPELARAFLSGADATEAAIDEDDSAETVTISLEGSYQEVADRLIAPHLPKTMIDQVDVGSDEGVARLLACLIARSGRASIEKDEILRFVAKNEKALRKGALDILRKFVDAAAKVEARKDQTFILEYFMENLELALAGRSAEMDMRSDRLFWLIYALETKLRSHAVSHSDAVSALKQTENRARISRHQLLYMIKDFADSLGSPQEAPIELLALVLECALIIQDEDCTAVVAEIVGKTGKRVAPWVWDTLERADSFLSARGRKASSPRRARRPERLPDDDL